jgi:hypothetical protein
MSRWCDHYAVTKDLADRFLFAGFQGTATVVELTDELHESGEGLRHEMNHTWEEIHRCLTDDLSDDLDFESGDYPLQLAIHGGEWLLSGQRTATLILADQVAELVLALRALDQPWFYRKLLWLKEEAPPYQAVDITDQYVGCVWDDFRALRDFYEQAAAAGLSVLCTISH